MGIDEPGFRPSEWADRLAPGYMTEPRLRPGTHHPLIGWDADQ
jgi:hypothetical protein